MMMSGGAVVGRGRIAARRLDRDQHRPRVSVGLRPGAGVFTFRFEQAIGRHEAHEAGGAARICRLKVRIFSGRLAIGEDFRAWFPRDEAADMNGIPCARARTAARKRANTGWVQLDPGLEATFQQSGQDRFDVIMAPGLRGPIPAANAFADAALLPAGTAKTIVLPCGLYAVTLHDADPDAHAKDLLARVRRIPEP